MRERPEEKEFHVVIESAEQHSVDTLHRVSEISRQKIKSAMTKGAVWLTRGSTTQRLRRTTRRLQVGDELHLYYNEQILAEAPVSPELIADIGGYSVWRKPFGLRSQGSKWGDHCTVTRWAETHLEPQRTAFTVHRLDRAANGLILVAHSKGVAAALSRLFRDRAVEKRYRVWVMGAYFSQETPQRVAEPIDGKPAVSEISVVRVEGDRSLLDVRIETGRKHQVRRHLAGVGFPIIGDRLYGDGAKDGVDLQLTAYLLAFHCPVADKPVAYHLPEEGL
ncbi:MAG: RNA pseudouridine synthase [Planctomycetota bacterium]|nr:RNA pseudouridine synthase [Planctomycetota bacterium]